MSTDRFPSSHAQNHKISSGQCNSGTHVRDNDSDPRCSLYPSDPQEEPFVTVINEQLQNTATWIAPTVYIPQSGFLGDIDVSAASTNSGVSSQMVTDFDLDTYTLPLSMFDNASTSDYTVRLTATEMVLNAEDSYALPYSSGSFYRMQPREAQLMATMLPQAVSSLGYVGLGGDEYEIAKLFETHWDSSP